MLLPNFFVEASSFLEMVRFRYDCILVDIDRLIYCGRKTALNFDTSNFENWNSCGDLVLRSVINYLLTVHVSNFVVLGIRHLSVCTP